MNVSPFHLILFWPLRVNMKEPDPRKPRDYWKFIDERMTAAGNCWEAVSDPLFRGGGTDDQTYYEEAAYFHPFVQKVIYARDTGRERVPLRLYRQTEVRQAKIRTAKGVEWTLEVNRLHLYFFETRLAILVTEVSHAGIELPAAMTIQKEMRKIYPAAWSRMAKGQEPAPEDSPVNCPLSVQWLGDVKGPLGPVSDYQDQRRFIGWMKKNISRQTTGAAHWVHLLPEMDPFEGAQGDEGKGYHLLGDDRMASMAYFAVEAPWQVSREDQVRMAYGDGPESTWPSPYAPEFLENFERTCCYDRFWTQRHQESRYEMFDTRYLCSGWAFVALGSQKTADANDSFFRTEILAHFRHHYFQLGLYVYLQFASLLVFSDRLSEAVGRNRDRQEDYRKELARIEDDLVVFTDRYWLTEVTNQIQGQELYQLWCDRLRLADLYGQVKDEVQFVNEAMETRDQGKINRQVAKITKFGFPGMIASLALGVLGMTPFVSRNGFEKYDVAFVMIVGLIFLTIGIAGLFWLFWLGDDE